MDTPSDSPDHLKMHQALAQSGNLLLDAINTPSGVFVYYRNSSGNVVRAPYDLTSGLIDSTSLDTVLVHDTNSGSYEENGITGASLQLCHARQVEDDTLTVLSGSTYTASHIGIVPASISVSGTGCTPTYSSAFRPGYHLDSDTYLHDAFDVTNTSGCSAVFASYNYTDCSFYDTADSTAEYVCVLGYDPDSTDGDSDTSHYHGPCRFFMVYEGVHVDAFLYEHHNLLLAYARDGGGPWQRYKPGGDSLPDSDDVILFNTSEHSKGSAPSLYSSTGGPSLIWDPDAGDATYPGAWRMYFSGEAKNAPGTMLSESYDDGKTWGIALNYSFAPDCYDSSGPGWDTTACAFPGWDTTGLQPPTDTQTILTPTVVDPDLVWADIDTDTNQELLLFTKGADASCSPGPQQGVILVSAHQDAGDMALSDWLWLDSLPRDSVYGRVLDQRSYACPRDSDSMGDTFYDKLADPTAVVYPLSGGLKGYIMFYMMKGHIYVAASNFPCSNWSNDDSTDTIIDYPYDSGCASPTDMTE